ncbi:hypothetical protein SKAU_G00352240 [Synaphobranchus kaupii]|uniref:UBZ4-type domain-containing protein n=1 Tax=Synaphobranchus kaupii TaxID=118154 RepID=A0A9Q1IIA1_SYNKA|nr:hypothetical protein SKAU_G00352240 [Synaphobranchus kaupii]
MRRSKHIIRTNMESVAQLLREAATTLEANRAPTRPAAIASELEKMASAQSSTQVVAQGRLQGEVSRLFSPYPRPHPTRRFSTPPTKKIQKSRTYTHQFFCLSGRGSTRSKILEVIHCPDEGYFPVFLSDCGVGQAVIYIRPLQKDLTMESAPAASTYTSGPKLACMYCGEKISQAEMQEHVDSCEKTKERHQNRETREASSSRWDRNGRSESSEDRPFQLHSDAQGTSRSSYSTIMEG